MMIKVFSPLKSVMKNLNQYQLCRMNTQLKISKLEFTNNYYKEK